MWKFADYVSRKHREAISHLKLVRSICERFGLEAVDKTDERDDPYVFVYNPEDNLSFEGVRVYIIGDKLAYRVQKEATTHPYGKAYQLSVDELFEDLISDNIREEKIAELIGKTIVSEIKEFFARSAEAEKDAEFNDKDPLDRVLMRPHGTNDYSSGISDMSRRTGTIY